MIAPVALREFMFFWMAARVLPTSFQQLVTNKILLLHPSEFF